MERAAAQVAGARFRWLLAGRRRYLQARHQEGAIRWVSTVSVPAAPTAYDVQVEPGGIARLPERLHRELAAAAYAVIADERVADDVAAPLRDALARHGATVTLHTHASGESAKTRASWAALTDRLLAAGLGRDGCVIAVGGGVTTDLAGFVAATYMRGIPVVQVPTSLLAMVDASVGGKTGVDTEAGKNLVGAFHAPRLVCIDPVVLHSLPDTELRAGLAEIAKHGAVADADYLAQTARDAPRLLAREPDALAEAIARSVAIKAEVVARDPHERGERAVLNFGHTLGHALELQHEYRLPHGFAVAIGMVAAARIGEHLGVSEPGTARSLRAALAALELPVALPDRPPLDDLVAAARLDKKARAGRTRYVLLRRPGAVARDGQAWTFDIPDAAVLAALRAPSA